ncbi:DUF4367 domain-containing protein [Lacrimispora sp. 38-1]|uniref:DUF4367 domain-containing protein n=1 Tax=Lacrimispora sp. 38-1 TaxID=3125778 RepID=UPI003CE6B884
MKKLVAIMLSAVLALSFTACSKQSAKVQMPNPLEDCKTIEDAEKIAGFHVTAPDKIPEGYTQSIIQAIKDDLVQIIYKDGENEITFRQGKDSEGNGDISGDYNQYKEKNTIMTGDLKVLIRGNDGKVSNAVWTNGKHAFSITANPGETGLDKNVIVSMIDSIR